ncbi:MAG TPA: hypothetical protein VFC41_00140 [Anaerovoracaceae bacterium]|nr:hypothetical protein [Anaerovoracaceae bacterium]
MGFIIRVLGNILLGGFLLGINILMLGFFGLLRNLPMILNLTLRFLNWFVRLTYRFYLTILTHTRSFIGQYLNLDIFEKIPRICASVVLSLCLFMLFYWIANISLSIFTIGLAVLHGLFVGYVWDGIIMPDGLHLGENIQ